MAFCNYCKQTFLPWALRDESNELEKVALRLQTLCQAYFDKAQEEFIALKQEALRLKNAGIDSRMVSRILCQKIDNGENFIK